MNPARNRRRWAATTFREHALAILLATTLAVATGCGEAQGTPSGGSGSLLDEIKKRGELTVGVRIDNPPHSSYNDQGKWEGFDLDVARAIAERWKVRLKLVKVDELTRISFIQNGRIDLAIASISKTNKRGRQVDFSQTYFFSKQTFVVRKGEISSLRDLVGKRVGASRGSSSIGNWQAWLSANGYPAKPDIKQYGDKRAALSAVQQGSIAGWTEDYEVLASYAKNDKSLIVLDEGTDVKLDGIAMRKDDSALRNAVNDALQDIASTGKYDKIYDRWFGPASDTPVPRQGEIEVWPNG